MEELLNKLIKKGWRPFKIKDNMYLYCFKDNKILISYYYFDTEWECNHEDKRCDYRQLTSKESGLWQFCCKNGMVKHEIYEDIQSWEHTTAEHSDFWYTSWDNYEYRIIECALKDESELEKFLLDNIKVEWQQNRK